MQKETTQTLMGLSADEAAQKLKEFGENSLPEVKVNTIWYKLFQQFNNPLIYILLFALILDVGIWVYEGAGSIPIEAIAILLILLANAGLGLWQSLKSEAALDHLKDLIRPKSWVIRDGGLRQIESKDLVPGDVVRVEAGERIPADGIIIELSGFMVDESILTGESAPVEPTVKQTVFSGTLAARGFAHLEVTQTGAQSNMGKLAVMLQGITQDKTPLEKKLARAGRNIAILVLALALLLLGTGLYLIGFTYFPEIFLFTVALAVAAVPESLPAVITLALALGVERMAKRKAVVRKMSAVEALGSVTVIATDKTGTLTENKMEVQKVDCVDEEESYLALILANDADIHSGAGDPLEIGILKYVEKQDTISIDAARQAYQRISTRQFDAQWKYMRATVVNPRGETVSYLKGAPEVLLARSALSEDEKTQWRERVDAYAGKGYRALAIARGEGEKEEELQWLGLVLLLDPPRKEISESIRSAFSAGIRVIMITGDHPETAKEIGRQIGILSEVLMTGDELDKLSESDFAKVIKRANIYARVSPEHKLKIVQALQNQGDVVAVTGDGVNDAPALKASDVGVAMGQRGSDVSREVADLVLLDDDFSTIIAAIEEGRSIFENIQKFMRFLFATNFAEVMLISIGALITFQVVGGGAAFLLPLTAAQILWINLLTDSIPTLAIATDKNQGLLTLKPRKKKASLFDKKTLQFIIFVGIVGSGFSLGMLLILPSYGIDREVIQTTVFCYLTVVQLAFVNPARRSHSLPMKNWLVGLALLITLGIQVLAVTLPWLRALLQIAPLTIQMTFFIISAVLISWLLALGCSQLLRKQAD